VVAGKLPETFSEEGKAELERIRIENKYVLPLCSLVYSTSANKSHSLSPL
jgi:hypothetical protein